MRFISGKYTSGELLDNVRAVEDWITNEFLARGPITDNTLQADMSKRLLNVSFGRNDCKFDSEGLPAIMVKIPYMRRDEIGFSGENPHEAFIVRGNVIPEFWVGKYPASTYGSGSSEKAVVLRRQDPRANLNFDQAVNFCAKGDGWHLVTNSEWMAIALWCQANGWHPRGNTSYGRAYQHTSERADTAYLSSGRPGRTSGGTGPVTWSHDGSPFGVFDLVGNVWEWVGGLRLMDGELQILPDNDAAHHSADQSVPSTDWMAVNVSGDLVDPGTEDTLKYDYDNVIAVSNAVASPSGDTRDTMYKDLGASVTAPEILSRLGLYPHTTDIPVGRVYMRNVGERLPRRGGRWALSSSAGLFSLSLFYPRASSASDYGFRPAYIEIW